MDGFRGCAAVVGLVAAGAAASVLATPRGDAHAAVPLLPGPFSNPTAFTNPYMPFEAGAVKAYAGKSRRERTAVVELYLTRTRDFDWNGMTITCVCLQETEFRGGQLTEISSKYFATGKYTRMSAV